MVLPAIESDLASRVDIQLASTALIASTLWIASRMPDRESGLMGCFVGGGGLFRYD